MSKSDDRKTDDRVATLRAAVAVGLDQLDRGEGETHGAETTEALAAAIKADARRRRESRGPGSRW